MSFMTRSKASERHMLGLNITTEKDGGILVEVERMLGGEETTLASTSDALLHLGMALQIILEAVGHILALRNQANVAGTELSQLAQ